MIAYVLEYDWVLTSAEWTLRSGNHRASLEDFQFAQTDARFLNANLTSMSFQTMKGHLPVQFDLRDPINGMETFARNRVRRGEAPVGDMKTVHLTKRTVIGGNAIGGRAGSQAKKSPHDRQGHWRHSEREIIAVNSGKGVREPRQITDKAAPQFKVVR